MPTGIGTALAIGAGAQLLGGVLGAGAAKDAATSQADAARDANWYQNQQYNQTREDQAPWRQAGTQALSQMQDPNFQKTFGANDYQQDPGYQFRLQEGQNAINASAAARGMANSGATMKALTKYGQDYATNDYQNAYNRFNNDQTTRFNRLSSLAGVGQQANNQLAQAGQNYANQVGQNTMAIGNAQSAGQIGQSNALNGAIGNGMNSWMQYNMMNKMFPSGGGAIPGTSAGTSYWDPSTTG